MRYVIVREIWLHDFGRLAVSCLSDTQFKQLAAGDTTEFILGMVFSTWCIVKLDFYVNLCRDCIILIVANDISHMGIKMISW